MTNRCYNNRRQLIARSFVSGILFLGMAANIGCTNSNEAISNLTDYNNKKPQDKATDVTIYYSDKASVKAIIHAKEFYRNETADFTDIKNGLKVEFLNDSQKVESILSASSARIYENEGNVIVRENVVVVNKKGEQLKTEELVWNQKLEKFYTDKKVQILTPPNQVMYGEGLKANADLSWYKINNLKGNISVDNKTIPQ
jgi:LPS export ABC transporter protein LptC